MRHAQAHDLVDGSVPRSSFYDSPFGRMFGRLEPWVPAGTTDEQREQTLLEFAHEEMVESDGALLSENKAIAAGYTYFGQFVDHDITFDPTSSVRRQNDPNKLSNFRTPRFDLDSVYGAGPEASPYLYDANDHGKFLIGAGESGVEDDLPRNHQGVALIGDPRNDENLIVSQLQLAFLKLHNRVLDGVRSEYPGLEADQAFRRAQRIVRWFYQYVVWNDFVRLLVHDLLHGGALSTVVDDVSSSKHTTARIARRRFYRWKQAPYIPVEFSVAAYRFGHSMVRPGYQVNTTVGIGEEFELPIFSDPHDRSSDLRGGRPLPAGFAIQWDWFFPMPSSIAPFPQNSRRIDTKLAPSMSHIPMGDTTVPLAFLNLRRGWRMDLPSGPAVADALGVPAAGRPLIDTGTPQESLWFYILKETTTLGAMSGKMLGPVGGTIVAEVFAGLLDGDPLSYVNLDPLWTPGKEPVLVELMRTASPRQDDWSVGDLLTAAGVDAPTTAASGPIVFPGTRGRRRTPSH